MPKVSICLPNFNTARYLPERLESIFSQTFKDWECIVSDNFSTDGAWEILKRLTSQDSRFKLEQVPKDPLGMYPNWNNCLQRASGEFIYIATSDDTMSADCLEKLVGALEEHSNCDLAHCCATFIDEESNPLDWKWETWGTVSYFGDLINAKHIRPPGHDSVLAFALGTPYYSITQLLIRRNLFNKVGLFSTCWGSFADLEWQMRAAIVSATVHIPEHLATWRKHADQATQMNKYLTAQRDGWFVAMVDSVIAFSRKTKIPKPAGLPRRLRRFFLFYKMYSEWSNFPNWKSKVHFLANQILSDPHAVFLFLSDFPSHRSGQHRNLHLEVKQELAALSLGSPYIV